MWDLWDLWGGARKGRIRGGMRESHETQPHGAQWRARVVEMRNEKKQARSSSSKVWGNIRLPQHTGFKLSFAPSQPSPLFKNLF